MTLRDVVIVHRPLEGSELGDVAGHQRDSGEVVRDEYLAEPASVLPDIETDDREPLADDLAHRPRADATEGTRDEEPFPAHATDRTLANRHTFSSRPIRSISTVIRSPSPRKRGGSRKAPTPPGVPVAITSPGSRVKDIEQ